MKEYFINLSGDMYMDGYSSFYIVNDCSQPEAIIAQRNLYFEEDVIEKSEQSLRESLMCYAGNVCVRTGVVDWNLWDVDSAVLRGVEDGCVFVDAYREIGGEDIMFTIGFYRVGNILRMYGYLN